MAKLPDAPSSEWAGRLGRSRMAKIQLRLVYNELPETGPLRLAAMKAYYASEELVKLIEAEDEKVRRG